MVLIIPAGCAGKKNMEAATRVAEDFMDSYFTCQYDHASELCSPEMRKLIEEANELYKAQGEGIREEMSRLSENVKHSISGVKTETDDTITFQVKISLPDSTGEHDSYMTLAKSGEDWKVVALH